MRRNKSKVDCGGDARRRVMSGVLDDLIERKQVRDGKNLIEEWGADGKVNIKIPKEEKVSGWTVGERGQTGE